VTERRPKVVIVGGGFGGLACARKLHRQPVDVLLLDGRNYHLFTPLLYQVATALLNPSDIAYPLRRRFRRSPNVRFRQEVVTSIDARGKTVRTASGDDVPFDYLVLATGSTNNYFGNEEIARATIGLKTLPEALRLRNHVLSCLERASQAKDEAERRRWLTFVIVGGGPTGVEYAGALVELLRLVLGRDYPDLSPGLPRIVVAEGRERLLEAFPERLSRYAERTLGRRGVEVRTGALVEKATEESALLSDGEEIATHTIVWSAGVRPTSPSADPDLPRSRTRRLRVDQRLRIRGLHGVFAIGDVAGADQGGAELPMLSPVAMQAGRYVAGLILDDVRAARNASVEAKPFRYVDKGTMATIGRNAAVGQIGRVQLTGFIGWIGWLVVHLYYLVGFRNRILVFSSWAWDYLKKDRPIRIITRATADPIVDRTTNE
jgi:NADH:ubiquinone reductase (H+-translocating)